MRVYHGAPFDIFGINLFAEWGDTGVATATVKAAEPAALGRSVHGQGDAVHQAVDIVWHHGLPQVPEITLPPAPAKTTAGRSAQP